MKAGLKARNGAPSTRRQVEISWTRKLIDLIDFINYYHETRHIFRHILGYALGISLFSLFWHVTLHYSI